MGLTDSRALPRTLTEALRALDRDRLVELLRLRPDLAYPLPRDLSELAAQSATGTSVRRVIERLNAWQRQVLEGLATLPDPAESSRLAELVGAPAGTVVETLGQLRDRALVWGPDQAVRLVRAVRDYFGPYPAGLAPESVRPLSSEQIAAALEACGRDVEPVLNRLLWGPPTGAVRQADRQVRPDQAQSPIERLLAHQLLRPLNSDTVILPREVAWFLRRRTSPSPLTDRVVAPEPPELSGGTRSVDLIDRAATGAALSLLHDVDLAARSLATEPIQLLRDGQMSSRDLTTLGRRIGGGTEYATFVVELAAAADLIAGRPGLRLLPTGTYDRWLTEPATRRWRTLSDAWLRADRYFSAAATEGGHPLGPEAESGRARETRALILAGGASAATGTLLDPGQLAELVRWHRPALARPPRLLDQVLDWTWREAGWLGLAALGATTTFWAVLAAGAELPEGLRAQFPEPIEQIIIQSDLTAVAPGPLAHAVAADLQLMAEEESRGGGSVYRFGPTSLRRAFDAGWTAGDLHAWLGRHSTTGVPQPLGYLIDDVARQHGSIRVGPAESVLRIDDPAQQAALLGHPEVASLRLRVLAPGVLAAGAAPEEVVEVLQRLGLTPMAEDASGRALTSRPAPRSPSQRRVEPAALDPESAADAVLAADRRRVDGEVGPGSGAVGTAERIVASLTAAAESSGRVRVSYVTADGTRSERILDGLRVLPGLLRATDSRTAESVTIPLSRISAVRNLTS